MSWFLEEMDDLDEYTISTFKQGHFVVRRSYRPYAGVSVDLAIEQSLMATLKGNQGLTHGRGFNDLNFLVWILSRPVVGKLSEMVSKMTGVNLHTPEQSSVKVKQEGNARIKQDILHMGLIENFLSDRCLFQAHENTNLMNLATGLVASKEVNVQNIRDVGLKIVEAMVGENLLTHTIKKKDLAI